MFPSTRSTWSLPYTFWGRNFLIPTVPPPVFRKQETMSGGAEGRTPVLQQSNKRTTRLFSFSKLTKYQIPIFPLLSATVGDSLVLM